MSETSNSKPGKLPYIVAGCAFLACIAIGFGPYALHDETAAAATFGDSFGFANAVISAAAFAGVILTLWLQMTELGYTRDEMKQTREANEAMAKAQQESEKRMTLAAYLNALEVYSNLQDWQMQNEWPSDPRKASLPFIASYARQLDNYYRYARLVQFLENHVASDYDDFPCAGDWKSRSVQLIESTYKILTALRQPILNHYGSNNDHVLGELEECYETAWRVFDQNHDAIPKPHKDDASKSLKAVHSVIAEFRGSGNVPKQWRNYRSAINSLTVRLVEAIDQASGKFF